MKLRKNFFKLHEKEDSIMKRENIDGLALEIGYDSKAKEGLDSELQLTRT